MKTTLTFNGPDDEYNLDNALNGGDMRAAIDEALNQIRTRLKYHEPGPTEEETRFLEKLRDGLAEGISKCKQY
jgi:hypothetical protein